MRASARTLVLVAAWVAVAVAVLGSHPALRDGAPLAGLAQQIAADAAEGRNVLSMVGLPGQGAPVAFWALVCSLLYIAGWGLFRLCPDNPFSPNTEIPVPLLVAAILGQVAATFAADVTVFYFLSAGVAALSLVLLWKRRAPALESRPGPARLILASALGILIVLLAAPLDTALASLTGAPLLPEAWFPIMVEFGSRPAAAVALSIVVAAACLALGLTRAGWLGLAPACALVFGPSNPAKGLAAAAVIALLGRSGAGISWRAGFLAALTALFVFIALRL